MGVGNAAFTIDGFFRGIGVARDVEPVAAPALAVFGAGEELIHEFGEGGGRGVGGELLHALVGRRQADEREVGATHEGARIGGGIGDEAFLGETGADEVIDGVEIHCRIRQRGHGR